MAPLTEGPCLWLSADHLRVSDCLPVCCLSQVGLLLSLSLGQQLSHDSSENTWTQHLLAVTKSQSWSDQVSMFQHNIKYGLEKSRAVAMTLHSSLSQIQRCYVFCRSSWGVNSGSVITHFSFLQQRKQEPISLNVEKPTPTLQTQSLTQWCVLTHQHHSSSGSDVADGLRDTIRNCMPSLHLCPKWHLEREDVKVGPTVLIWIHLEKYNSHSFLV